jgi:hypothetical protein
VDKSKDDTAAAEVQLIASKLDLTQGQLGWLLGECKKRGCRLQDLYSTLLGALQKNGLRGGRAMSYLLACLAENPSRDWTAMARREAQEANQQAHRDAEAAQLAEARAALEAAGAAGVQVAAPHSGKSVLVRPHPFGWSSGLVEILDPTARESLGNAQLSEFVQALASPAALEGRATQ